MLLPSLVHHTGKSLNASAKFTRYIFCPSPVTSPKTGTVRLFQSSVGMTICLLDQQNAVHTIGPKNIYNDWWIILKLFIELPFLFVCFQQTLTTYLQFLVGKIVKIPWRCCFMSVYIWDQEILNLSNNISPIRGFSLSPGLKLLIC